MKIEPESALKSIESIIKEICSSSDFWASSDPAYSIKGEGYDWFYSTSSNNMVRVIRGTEIYPVKPICDTDESIQCVYNLDIIMIPKEDIHEIGWN